MNGTRWLPDESALLFPDAAVAHLGAQISTGGGYTSRLESLTDKASVHELAKECVGEGPSGGYGEVAFVGHPVEIVEEPATAVAVDVVLPVQHFDEVLSIENRGRPVLDEQTRCPLWEDSDGSINVMVFPVGSEVVETEPWVAINEPGEFGHVVLDGQPIVRAGLPSPPGDDDRADPIVVNCLESTDATGIYKVG